MINLTESYLADRNKQVIERGIKPDVKVAIECRAKENQKERDAVLIKGIQWIGESSN